MLFDHKLMGISLYISLHCKRFMYQLYINFKDFFISECERGTIIFINLSTLSLDYQQSHVYTQQIKMIMQEGQTLNKALQTINSIKKDIDGMINSPDQKILLDILQKTTEQVKQDHLGIIIALHKDGQLSKLIKTVRMFHGQKRRESIEKHITIIFHCAYECFFKHIGQKYQESFTYFMNKIPNLNMSKNFKQYTKNYANYQILRTMLIKLFEITKNQDIHHYQKGELLNKYASQILNVNRPKTYIQECVFTFIRSIFQEAQAKNFSKSNENKLGFCCNLHFEHRGSKNHVETQSQNFTKQFEIKAFSPKQHLSKQIQTIKKHTISYLNSAYGIYYLGIDYNIKEARFTGIPLDEKKKKQLVSILFSQVVMKIFPSDGQNEDEDEKIQQARLNKLQLDKKNEITNSKQGFNYEYILNSYISVDFINLYDRDTWFYARKDELPLYIVRIKVRIGSQYEVYHHINSKQIPEAFLREDKKEKKLDMIQYYDEVYRRLKNKANNKVQNKAVKYHPLCRAFESIKK